MDPCNVYTISLGSAFAVFIGWHLAAEAAKARHKSLALVRKYAVQTAVLRRSRGTSTVSIGWFVLIVLLMTANVVGTLVGNHGLLDVARRLGNMSVVNTVTLFCLSGRNNLIADFVLGSSLPTQALLHRWLGRLSLLQGVVHGILQVSSAGWDLSPITICVVSLSIVLIISSILYIRRWYYEVFLRVHEAMAVAYVTMLWLHCRTGRNIATFALALSSMLWAFSTAAKCGELLFQNWQGKSKADLTHLTCEDFPSAALQMRITLKRPWSVHPGQYVYITAPAAPYSLFAAVQAHPYLVAWSSEMPEKKSQEIVLLIERRHGFSERLRACHPSTDVLVSRPHGRTLNMEGYDKVLFVATGSGVAAHLLSLRHLLQAHDDQTARVRRVSLLWFLEFPGQLAWAQPFLQQLMEMDKRRIFTILLYTPLEKTRSSSPPTIMEPDPQWPRMFHIAGHLDFEWVLDKEWSAEAGNMLVSLCATPRFEMRVRKALKRAQHDIALMTSEFEPDESTQSEEASSRYQHKTIPNVNGHTQF